MTTAGGSPNGLIFGLAAAGFALICLAGCGLAHAPGAPPMTSGRGWYFVSSVNEPAKLVHGLADTDDVDLLLWCDPARREVLFEPSIGEESLGDALTLQVGRRRLDLKLAPTVPAGPAAAVPFNAPLLAAFRSAGQIRMRLNGARPYDSGVATPKDRRQVAAFFQACQ